MNFFEFGAAFAGLFAFYVVAPIFPFLYVVLRWRAGGEPRAGTVGALLYFSTVGLLMALAGLSMLLYGAISEGEADESLRRTSWAILLAGVLLYALNRVLATFAGVPLADHPARRVFGGFLMVVTGLVFAVALTGLLIGAFDADAEANVTRFWLCWTAVWLSAYLQAGFRLSRR